MITTIKIVALEILRLVLRLADQFIARYIKRLQIERRTLALV